MLRAEPLFVIGGFIATLLSPPTFNETSRAARAH
jgi:hypothetical protein